MDNIQIRTAKSEDLQQILLLSDELTLSDLPYDSDVDIRWAHTGKGMKYYSEKINRKNGVSFIAEYNKKIVGYATAAIKEIPSYRLVKVVELENLLVNKEMRSKKIGKQLMNYFLKWAKEIEADRASVNVFAFNEKGVAFYEREGFISRDTTLELSLKSNTK